MSQIGRKWGYSEGGGRFNTYIKELLEEGRLKRKTRGDAFYLAITLKGEFSILPFILPRLLIMFTLIISLAIIALAIPGVMVHFPTSPYLYLALGIVVLSFSLIDLFLQNRLEWSLLNED